jgi:hypothetical protein
MTFKFERPPEELTWYYRYRVSGVSNNAVACVWCGLLAPDDDGLLLTDLGRQMLADWKTSPAGQKWLTEWSALDDEPGSVTAPTDSTPPALPANTGQLGLFDQPTA